MQSVKRTATSAQNKETDGSITAKRLKVSPIKEGKDVGKHPDYAMGKDIFPPHEFSYVIIAPRGSGKTTLILNFLSNFMKGYFHRIVVFSPTMAGDSKWETVKNMRGVLTLNRNKEEMEKGRKKNGPPPEEEPSSESDDEEGGGGSGAQMSREEAAKRVVTFENSFHSLFGNVAKTNREQVGDVGQPPAGSYVQGYMATQAAGAGKKGKPKKQGFSGRMRKSDMYSHYEEEDLQRVMTEQMNSIRRLKRKGKSKHEADRTLLVFDDLVGSSLFSAKKNNPFRRLNATMRHYSMSAMMVSQAYKEIPKTVRVNGTGLILFSIDNQSELKSIYEENTCGLTEDDWLKVYHQCTDKPFGFMYINYARPKGERIFSNFDTLIRTKEEVPDTGEELRQGKTAVKDEEAADSEGEQ